MLIVKCLITCTVSYLGYLQIDIHTVLHTPPHMPSLNLARECHVDTCCREINYFLLLTVNLAQIWWGRLLIYFQRLPVCRRLVLYPEFFNPTQKVIWTQGLELPLLMTNG